MSEAKTAFERAMEVTEQADADAILAEIVLSLQNGSPQMSREAVEASARECLAYFAGRYSFDTRVRVERLFQCVHPFFGAAAENGLPTSEQCLEMYRQMGLHYNRETRKRK